LALAAWALASQANDPPLGGKGPAAAGKSGKGTGPPKVTAPKMQPEPPQLKVFRLRHMKAEGLAQVAGQLFGAPVGRLPSPPPQGAGTRGHLSGGRGAGGSGASPLGGSPSAPGGFGAQGGSFGMPMGMGIPFGRAVLGLRLVADPSSNTLLARGSKSEVGAVGELVRLLDHPKGKGQAKGAGLAVFNLKSANPEAVASAISQLGIRARVAIVPGERAFVVSGDESQIQEAQEVVQALDVEQRKLEENKE
jgi:type II secretory pathway component GspD/PulD (secretin)